MRISSRAVVLTLALSAVGVWAAQPDKAAVERGGVLFGEHCGACHGKAGKGDGPAAATMTRKPTDLTLMRERNGAFFTAQIESAVHGTNASLRHRAPEMVVWGALFRADARGNQAAAEARLRDLVAFIESIQEK